MTAIFSSFQVFFFFFYISVYYMTECSKLKWEILSLKPKRALNLSLTVSLTFALSHSFYYTRLIYASKLRRNCSGRFLGNCERKLTHCFESLSYEVTGAPSRWHFHSNNMRRQTLEIKQALIENWQKWILYVSTVRPDFR